MVNYPIFWQKCQGGLRVRATTAEAMEAEAGDVAADAVERAPEIRDESMGVMEDHGGRVEPLRYVRAALQAQPALLRASRHPRKRKVGHQVVVVVQSAHIAMAAWKQYLHDTALLALERHMAEELACLVPRDGVTCLLDVGRTLLGHVQSYRGIDRVPKP